MGVEYRAIAILGIKIYMDRIPRLKMNSKKPAFKHTFPETDNFHPKTGQPLWTDEIIQVDSKEPRYVLAEEGIYGQLFENDKLTSTLLRAFEGALRCYVEPEKSEGCWVGLILDDTGSNGGGTEDFCVVPPDLKEFLRETLEPYGLWDDNNYGLHCILDVSC